MEGIRQYILSVSAAAILCAVIGAFFPSKNTFSAVMKLLTGMLLVIVLISPLVNIEFSDYEDFFSNITADAASITQDASTFANESLETLIKEKTQAYILDKAASLTLDIQIQVELDESTPPTPEIITITGNAAPLQRQNLINTMIQELDIAKENIIWK